MRASQELRWKQSIRDNEERRKRYQDADKRLENERRAKAQEALEGRRLERHRMDELMRNPAQQPAPPKKQILRKGGGSVMKCASPKPQPAVQSNAVQPNQLKPETDKQRRGWSEGLKQYIARQRETAKATGPEGDPEESFSWQQLKVAAEAGFEQLLRHQEAAAAAAAREQGAIAWRRPSMSRAKGGGPAGLAAPATGPGPNLSASALPPNSMPQSVAVQPKQLDQPAAVGGGGQAAGPNSPPASKWVVRMNQMLDQVMQKTHEAADMSRAASPPALQQQELLDRQQPQHLQEQHEDGLRTSRPAGNDQQQQPKQPDSPSGLGVQLVASEGLLSPAIVSVSSTSRFTTPRDSQHMPAAAQQAAAALRESMNKLHKATELIRGPLSKPAMNSPGGVAALAADNGMHASRDVERLGTEKSAHTPAAAVAAAMVASNAGSPGATAAVPGVSDGQVVRSNSSSHRQLDSFSLNGTVSCDSPRSRTQAHGAPQLGSKIEKPEEQQQLNGWAATCLVAPHAESSFKGSIIPDTPNKAAAAAHSPTAKYTGDQESSSSAERALVQERLQQRQLLWQQLHWHGNPEHKSQQQALSAQDRDQLHESSNSLQLQHCNVPNSPSSMQPGLRPPAGTPAPLVTAAAPDAAAEDDSSPAASPTLDSLLAEVQQLAALRKALKAEFAAMGHAGVVAAMGPLGFLAAIDTQQSSDEQQQQQQQPKPQQQTWQHGMMVQQEQQQQHLFGGYSLSLSGPDVGVGFAQHSSVQSPRAHIRPQQVWQPVVQPQVAAANLNAIKPAIKLLEQSTSSSTVLPRQPLVESPALQKQKVLPQGRPLPLQQRAQQLEQRQQQTSTMQTVQISVKQQPLKQQVQTLQQPQAVGRNDASQTSTVAHGSSISSPDEAGNTFIAAACCNTELVNDFSTASKGICQAVPQHAEAGLRSLEASPGPASNHSQNSAQQAAAGHAGPAVEPQVAEDLAVLQEVLQSSPLGCTPMDLSFSFGHAAMQQEEQTQLTATPLYQQSCSAQQANTAAQLPLQQPEDLQLQQLQQSWQQQHQKVKVLQHKQEPPQSHTTLKAAELPLPQCPLPLFQQPQLQEQALAGPAQQHQAIAVVVQVPQQSVGAPSHEQHAGVATGAPHVADSATLSNPWSLTPATVSCTAHPHGVNASPMMSFLAPHAAIAAHTNLQPFMVPDVPSLLASAVTMSKGGASVVAHQLTPSTAPISTTTAIGSFRPAPVSDWVSTSPRMRHGVGLSAVPHAADASAAHNNDSAVQQPAMQHPIQQQLQVQPANTATGLSGFSSPAGSTARDAAGSAFLSKLANQARKTQAAKPSSAKASTQAANSTVTAAPGLPAAERPLVNQGSYLAAALQTKHRVKKEQAEKQRLEAAAAARRRALAVKQAEEKQDIQPMLAEQASQQQLSIAFGSYAQHGVLPSEYGWVHERQTGTHGAWLSQQQQQYQMLQQQQGTSGYMPAASYAAPMAQRMRTIPPEVVPAVPAAGQPLARQRIRSATNPTQLVKAAPPIAAARSAKASPLTLHSSSPRQVHGPATTPQAPDATAGPAFGIVCPAAADRSAGPSGMACLSQPGSRLPGQPPSRIPSAPGTPHSRHMAAAAGPVGLIPPGQQGVSRYGATGDTSSYNVSAVDDSDESDDSDFDFLEREPEFDAPVQLSWPAPARHKQAMPAAATAVMSNQQQMQQTPAIVPMQAAAGTAVIDSQQTVSNAQQGMWAAVQAAAMAAKQHRTGAGEAVGQPTMSPHQQTMASQQDVKGAGNRAGIAAATAAAAPSQQVAAKTAPEEAARVGIAPLAAMPTAEPSVGNKPKPLTPTAVRGGKLGNQLLAGSGYAQHNRLAPINNYSKAAAAAAAAASQPSAAAQGPASSNRLSREEAALLASLQELNTRMQQTASRQIPSAHSSTQPAGAAAAMPQRTMQAAAAGATPKSSKSTAGSGNSSKRALNATTAGAVTGRSGAAAARAVAGGMQQLSSEQQQQLQASLDALDLKLASIRQAADASINSNMPGAIAKQSSAPSKQQLKVSSAAPGSKPAGTANKKAAVPTPNKSKEQREQRLTAAGAPAASTAIAGVPGLAPNKQLQPSMPPAFISMPKPGLAIGCGWHSQQPGGCHGLQNGNGPTPQLLGGVLPGSLGPANAFGPPMAAWGEAGAPMPPGHGPYGMAAMAARAPAHFSQQSVFAGWHSGMAPGMAQGPFRAQVPKEITFWPGQGAMAQQQQQFWATMQQQHQQWWQQTQQYGGISLPGTAGGIGVYNRPSPAAGQSALPQTAPTGSQYPSGSPLLPTLHYQQTIMRDRTFTSGEGAADSLNTAKGGTGQLGGSLRSGVGLSDFRQTAADVWPFRGVQKTAAGHGVLPGVRKGVEQGDNDSIRVYKAGCLY